MSPKLAAMAAVAFAIPIAVVVAANIDQLAGDPDSVPEGRLLVFYRQM